MMAAPVVLFTYNRPRHVRSVLASLQHNAAASDTPLYVFSDGPKTFGDTKEVEAVRRYLLSVSGFANMEIKCREENAGLAASVIEGVSEVLEKHPSCIVLEDDLEVSPYFLQFMNNGLEAYQNNPGIFSIAGYCPPIAIPAHYPHEAFRFPRINSWGWATWRDRWDEIDWQLSDFDKFIHDKSAVRRLEQQGKDLPVMLLKQQQGKINSWAVRFNQACFSAGQTNIYPVQSLVRNAGADGTGTHMKSSRRYRVEMANKPLLPMPAENHPEINKAFKRFYDPSLFRQGVNWGKLRSFLPVVSAPLNHLPFK